MSAGHLDLYYEQGILRPAVLQVERPVGTPFDLTGYEARMDVMEYPLGPSALVSLSSLDGSIVLGGTAGTITLNFPPTLRSGRFVYDLKLLLGGVAVERLVEGSFFSSPQVTDASYPMAGACVAPTGP
jgi:hypothetical protein